jgi:hypothetical protein
MIADAFSPDDVIAMIGAGRIKDVPTIAAPGHLRLLGRLQTARLTRSLAQADKCLLCGTKRRLQPQRSMAAFDLQQMPRKAPKSDNRCWLQFPQMLAFAD